ncbi:MAG TPA: phospholipase A2, partial [Mycobacteriales bacterium]|nr:phospholipase A2 [Mycobacteriales bacterium]
TVSTAPGAATLVPMTVSGRLTFTLERTCRTEATQRQSGSYTAAGVPAELRLTEQDSRATLAVSAPGFSGRAVTEQAGGDSIVDPASFYPALGELLLTAGAGGALTGRAPASSPLGSSSTPVLLGSAGSFTGAPAGEAVIALTRSGVAPRPTPTPVPLPTPTPTPTPTPQAPLASCDTYWARPGTVLNVVAAQGLLSNDNVVAGRSATPRVSAIYFRGATHPYAVSATGALTLQTLKADRRLQLAYFVQDRTGARSATVRVTVLVSATRPPASAFAGCPPPRILRGANPALPTALPSSTKDTRAVLADSIASWAKWQKISRNRGISPYKQMDFAQDGCSDPTKAAYGAGFDFTAECVRHDFGYRNSLWLGRFNQNRPATDKNLGDDAARKCTSRYASADPRRALCLGQAKAYHRAVVSGGGSSVPEQFSTWAGLARARVLTVFQPIDNVYLRGVLEDTTRDGRAVRLQASFAKTGFNSPWITIARNTRGEGNIQTYDYSYNEEGNLKGVFLRLCAEEPLTCGPRFYVDKP